MIKVFGHKSPDTDTVCSAIAYAWYLTNRKNIESKAYIQGSINRETEFVLNAFKVNRPDLLGKLSEADKVVIVDTNNPEELPDNLESAEILEILDHHKLAGGLSTSQPISVTIKPIACTATIIWQKMNQEGNADISKDIAGLMVSAITSDTLKFTSPTTTEEDRKAAQELAKIAGIDIDKHAKKMFESKSDLSGMNPSDILLSDSKIFDMSSKKVRISVIETTKPENALQLKGDLITQMQNIKKNETLYAMFFFIIDILKSEATLIVPSKHEESLAEKAFNSSFKDGIMILPGIVSRKKQIVPAIEKFLA